MEAAIKVYKLCGTKECDDEHAAKMHAHKMGRLEVEHAEKMYALEVCGTKECDDEHAAKMHALKMRRLEVEHAEKLQMLEAKRKQKKIQRLRPKLAETKR
jgi:ABC-type branched-subunit amino acid transport system ATPase component